jgi:hypothetical protein
MRQLIAAAVLLAGLVVAWTSGVGARGADRSLGGPRPDAAAWGPAQ